MIIFIKKNFRTQNRRTNRGGFEPTIKKMKFEGEIITF